MAVPVFYAGSEVGTTQATSALPVLGKEEAAPLQEGGFKIEPLRPWTEEQVNAFTEAVRYTMLAAVRDGRPMASLRTQEILDRAVEAPAGHPAPHLRQRCLSGAQEIKVEIGPYPYDPWAEIDRKAGG